MENEFFGIEIGFGRANSWHPTHAYVYANPSSNGYTGVNSYADPSAAVPGKAPKERRRGVDWSILELWIILIV